MRARLLISAGLAAGAAEILRRLATADGQGGGSGGQPDRWHFVTINRPQDEVAPDGRIPDPLAEMGDRIDVQIRPAPADKGTEVGARMRHGVPSGLGEAVARVTGDDPRHELRMKLRQTKSTIECGEVVQPDPRPSHRRTPLNLPLELATSRARGEGRL